MEKDEIMQMRGMFEYYRGTMNRPDSYGSDMYNDATDMAVSDPKALVEIGRDENDNPIMTSPTAQAQMGTGEEPEEKSMLAGALDVVAPIVKPVGGSMLGYLYRFGEATDEERKTMTIPYMAKTAAQKVIHNMDDATKIEHSDLYMNFFYNAEQKNAEANRIAKLLKIDADAFMHDQKLFQQAALAAERVERMGKFREYQDANGDIDMDKIYAAIPGLAAVQKQHGTQAAALALGNADGVKSITDVYSNAFTRFFGSLGTGIQRSMYTSFVGDIWSKLRQERRMPNAEEQERLDNLEAKLKDLPAYSYDSAGEAVGAAMGSALENLWMIGGSQKFAVTASALAGLYSGNPVVAKRTYDLISTAVMADDIAAQQYKENVQKLDKYGRPMYTPEQAALLSEGQGVGEAILEQFSFKQMGRAIFGKSVGVEIQSIIKKSATNEAAKAGFKELALLKIKKAAEAGFITGSAETFEEFSQSVSDMVMENIAQVLIKGKDAELNSLEDIFYKSAAQAAAAIPAIAGFGIFGFLGHPVANTRAVLSFRSNVRRVVTDSMIQGAMANAHYREVLTGVWANKQNIKELQNKAPEVVGTLLDEHNKKAGLSYGFVDVKTLAQQKGGKELVEQIAQANNISADELAVCMDGSGMLQVKTSTLMQMDLQDDQKNAITDNLTTSLDAVTRAQHKEALQIASTQLKDLQAYEDKTYKQSVDNIIAARFPDAEQARLAREIIEANYENPQAEFKRRLDAVNAEINEIIDPVLRELRHGMKQGVTLVRDAEGNATGARVSNNDQWYSNYYADYGRAPSNEGLINLAMDIASGRQDPRYGLPDYQNNTDESREYFAGVAERLDKLEEERDALRAIKDRLQELRPSEMSATATLSKEGLEVYDAAIRWMGTSNNEKVQKAGRLNALLLARYADNMAKVFSRIKQKPYTAKDFIRERLKIDVNAVQEKMQNAAQLFQVSPAEFERQKAEVRKQYEGSDQWMKAPNGEPTNLTEDQWVTVRTPAFKNWFGDWEYIANAYPKGRASERKDVNEYIKSLKGKQLKSVEENIIASFSHKGLGKVASDAAINKSKRNGFSMQEHLTAVLNIEKLFSNSIKTNEREDHNDSIKGIEHFSSLFMAENNEPALVTFTVKVTENAGRKIYSIELMELKKVEGKVQGEARKLHQATSTFDTLNISRIAEKINNYSKIVDKNGEPRPFYHGTQRMDRVGDTFLPERATSGPMAFFTSSKEIATNYSKDKIDTSLQREASEYKDQFTVALPNGKKVNIVDYWNHLSTKEKNAIRKTAGHVTFDDEADNIIFDPNVTYGVGDLEYKIKNSNGNVLQALVDEWLTDGNIWGSEEKFLEVLKLAGVKADVEYLDPNKVVSGVFEVYLNVHNPFNTNNIDEQFIKDLEEASKTAKEYQGNVSDMWDKGRQTPAQFVERVKSDYEAGTTHAWTSIPDWVTDLLKSKGHDGILDKGGKNGGQVHDVAIPFASNQIKDATGRNVGFDPESGNIYLQMAGEHVQYYQQPRLKGSITENDRGQRLISLFEGADQSTFVHEMAHMFLMDLQEIAGIDPNGREAKDLKTIMDWAQYRPGQADEYKGTSSEAEFRSREEAIKAAVAAGNMQEAERLKNVWAQERFARGFEEYLWTGEAPARGLKYAFRQFKKWLMNIYRDVTGAGVRATPEVEAIMARMIASDEEIEALAAANNIARLKKLDPDILTDDVAAMRERWQEEGKEKAKEKMLRQLVKQYEQQNLKDLDKKLKDVREASTLEMQNIPCFVCEELLAQGNSMETALDICEFGTDADSLEKREAMYKEALYAAGGSLKQAVEREVSLARAQMLKAMPSQEELYKMAEEALNSGVYNARLSELEALFLQAREKAYNEIPAKLQAAFTDLDGALGDLKKESWEAVKKKIQELKYAERWKAEEFAMLKEFEDAAAKLDPDDKEAVDRLLKEYQRIKDMVVRNKDWVRGVRDATKGQVEALRLKAQAQMDRQPISAATNPRHWQRQAFAEGKAAWDALSKSQGKGIKNGTIEYRNAISAKMQQALYDFMTALAIKNRKRLDQLLNGRDGMYARAKRMADPKFKADADMRYFHNHLMYVVGLRTTDAIAPATEKSFVQLLNELREAHEFEDEVPNWIIQLASADTRGKQIENYQQLTMGELEELDKVLKILYTMGRNKNRLLTLDVDMDTVRAEMVAGYESHTDYEVGNQRINEIKGDIGDMMNSLLKPERILSILGGKDGPFVKYIYRILYSAAEAEEKALEQEAKAEKALYDMYTHEELRAMVNDPIMVEGKDGIKTNLQIGADTDITKEHLICMALNWGNKLNRARLIVGLFDSVTSSDIEIRSNELMQILQTHLTKKDWAFVQAMWDHIGTFADPVSGVLEKSLGVPLNRVKADAFTVTLPDGETLQMQGGYYPIVKDSGKSSRQSEFEQMEEAKQIAGAAVFGAGIGQTKNRSDNEKLNQGPLKLSLDVASRHIKAQIHLVHARMAVRDAYKVLNDASVKDMIERACGTGTFKMLNEYVLNCWAPPIQPHHWLEKYAAKLRGKTVSAIMAYRTMTALLNTLPNVVYMAQEIGTGNALSAIADFYKDWTKNRNTILDLSVFMRNRATNMDRDLNAQQEKFLNRHEGLTGKLANAADKYTGGKLAEMDYLVNKYANKLIEETDMMVSMPLYKWQFEQTFSEEIAKGVPVAEARETANYEATRRVTKVFGSSRAVDSSAVQRSRNEFVKLLTPFFTFANTMMNAVWSKHYEQKLQGKNYGNEKVALRNADGNVLKDAEGNIRYTTEREQSKFWFRYRYGRFVRAILMNYLLGALVETWMRQLPDVLAGTGDDDDDEYKFAKESAKNIISGAAAGFPGINMMADLFNTYVIEGKMYGGRGVGVISGSVDRYVQVGKDLLKITQGSDKIDVLDLVRDCVKAGNTRTGFSDTLTDAIFNTARFAVDDYELSNPEDLREYIAKTLFDRKLKKRK